MRKIAEYFFVTGLALGVMFLSPQAKSFDFNTHQKMGERAAENSQLDNLLKQQLGLPEGRLEVFNGTSVTDLVANGSRAEDSPPSRVLHHFHNPTRVWNDAGLRVLGIEIGQSSILWSQNPGQTPGGRHSWHDARSSFFQALAATTDGERQTAYANTFQVVGHLTHLIQDAANPAHTRNDSHLIFIDNDGFHTWAERPENLALISPSLPFDLAILGIASNPLAPIPIARIIDTEGYRQTGVPQAGLNIGIAEYSNANFFSDDTIFRDFPFPAAASVELGPPEPEPKKGKLRRYFRKIYDGEVVNHLAIPSAFYDDLQLTLADQNIGLDDKVFMDYGTLLFPRAVGYSAGLIDYFFRGKIDFVPDPNNASKYILKNLASEGMSGTFTLYYDAVDGNRYPVAGDAPDKTWAARTIAANGQLDNLSFIPPANPEPKWSDEYMLVFNGDMGEEKALGGGVGAVAGKVIGGVPTMPKVAAGTNHVLMTSNGQVKATGSNGAGQLGHDNSLPTIPYRDVFVVDGLDNVTNVAAIRFESFALKRDGSVWGWGSSAGSYIPVQVPGLTDVKQISGAAALKKDGTVWVLDQSPLIFSQIPGLSNVKRIAGGREITAALLNDGSVYVYGDGYLGIFGDGSFGPGAGSGLRKVPITDVVGITAGLWGVLAWKKDGTLWGWGFNFDRQLGVNMQISFTQVSGYGTVYCYCNPTPAQVTEVSGVTSAVLGRFFSLVNEGSSKVWKMGDAFVYPYYPRVIGTNYTDEMAVTDLHIVLVNASNGAVSISTTQGGVIGDPIEIY